MKVLEYIQSESDRQSATLDETIGMVHVWEYLRNSTQTVPNNSTIIHMAKILTGAMTTGYRLTPAVFNQGRPAIDASLIPNAMQRWHEAASNIVDFKTEFDIDRNEWVLDRLMKEFLEIHPFADGNGRVASLLYNHFRGTILDPEPLPYYFGEN